MPHFSSSLACVLIACSMVAAADSKVTVRAVSVQEIRSKVLVQSENEDEEVGMSSVLQVVIELIGEPAGTATQFGQLAFKAADDKGAVLKQRKPFVGDNDKMTQLDRTMMWLGMTPPKDRIRLELNMDIASRQATKIASIDGSVTLLSGTPMDIFVSDLGKHANKPLENRELADAGLKATIATYNPRGAASGAYIRLQVTGDLSAMASIDVVDPAGKTLTQGSGVSPGYAGRPTTYDVFGDAPLPATARLKITLLTDIKKVAVPIKLKDVPLP